MEIPPGLARVLEKLGVNTTQLNWRLYRWQQKRERAREGSAVPAGMRWMQYQHKFCRRCNALNDREARVCHKCGARLPSMAGYRVSRLLGFHSPGGGAPISYAFLTVIAFTFMLSILRDGFTGLFRPSSETFLIFGGFVAEVLILPPAWWRVLAFGLAHIGLIHVLFNGFALSQIAPIVERNVGSARMLVVITLTQIGAAVGTFIWYGMVLGQPGFTAGASGWLFGLIGYGISYFRSAGGSGSDISSALVRWAIYGFIFGLLVPNINNAAHGGGFLVGLALGTLPAGSPMLERRPGAGWMAAAGVSALLWLGAAGMLALSIFVNWSVAPAG